MADEKKLSEKTDELVKGFGDINEQIKELGGNLTKAVVNQLSAATTNASNLANKLAESTDISKNIKELTSELNKVLSKSEQLSVSRAIAEKKLAKAIQDGNLIDERKYKREFSRLSLQLKLNQNIEDQIRKTLQVAEEEERVTKEKQKQSDLTENIKNKAKDMFKPALEIFTVAGILDAVVSRVDMFNKNSVQIGKNFGYGAGQADRLERRMVGISLSAQSTTVNIKNLNEAMNDLNSATGGVAEYSEDALTTQIMLTKQFGLTGEEAAGIYKFSVLTGKSSEKVNDEMVAAFANTRNAVKGSADFKTTMAAAAKVSGQLAANFKNNPALITAAVVKMQALGTTLEQTKKQGESLLNFEESLDNELKAELLTGKQLNLERARAAALSGDQVTLAEELAKNVGTLEDFQSMNVMQQKAMADAMGMTTDEMADQLRKQKIATEQGKSLAEVNAEEAKKA